MNCNLKPLPSGDADYLQMKQKFLSLQFDVQFSGFNSQLNQMVLSTSNFMTSLNDDDTSVFYFSGHGNQVDGRNKLFSDDGQAFDLQAEYLSKLSKKKGTHILILDCCRSAGKGPGISYTFFIRQLLIFSESDFSFCTLPNFFVMYATSDGDVAFSGPSSSTPSLFTKCLLDCIDDAIPIEQLSKNVRIGLAEMTKGAQRSVDSSGLMCDFSFKPSGC